MLITGRNQQKLEKAHDDLTKRTGGEVHAAVADMTKETDIANITGVSLNLDGGRLKNLW